MPVPITALYAALLGLVMIVLQLLVGRQRLDTDVSLYDGGHPALAVAIRRHANWAEHVPFALILLALIELNGASAVWLHGLGATLLVARIVHPFGDFSGEEFDHQGEFYRIGRRVRYLGTTPKLAEEAFRRRLEMEAAGVAP